MFDITLFLEDCEDVRLTHHEIFLTLELQLCATVLAIQYLIASFEDHFFVLGSLAYLPYSTSSPALRIISSSLVPWPTALMVP